MKTALTFIFVIMLASLPVWQISAQEATSGEPKIGWEAVADLPVNDLLNFARTKHPLQLEAILQLGYRAENLDQTVPLLLQQLGAAKELVRLAAERSLVRIGDRTIPYIETLVAANQDPNATKIGGTVIHILSPKSVKCIETIDTWLNSDDPQVKFSGLYAYQNYDNETKLNASTAILNCLDKNQNFNFHVMTCRLLLPMGRDAEFAEAKLLQRLQDGNISGRTWAARALAAIGPTTTIDIAALLDDKLKHALIAIDIERYVQALGSLGPDATASLEQVKMIATTHRDLTVKTVAAVASYQISERPDTALQVLGEVLEKDNNIIVAIDAIGDLERMARPLLKPLCEKLDSNDPGVREAAVVAIGKIDPLKCLAQLKACLTDEDALVRDAARTVLGKMKAAKATPQF